MPRGTGELTRVLRELFNQVNRGNKRTAHRTISKVKDSEETLDVIGSMKTDYTQPSSTPKWGDSPSWDRDSDNILWTEGAQWQ